jgi:hypothetical protein
MLSDAVADGRLTPAEHADRVELAYSARTLGALARLTTDLAPADAQPIRLDGRRPVTGLFGRDGRTGRWVVPDVLPVLAVFGDVELDLREAIFSGGRVVVYATMIAGNLHVIVPEGVTVETTGTSVLTRKRIDRYARPGSPAGAWRLAGGAGSAGSGPAGPEAASVRPVIELRTVGVGGTVRVSAPRPPKPPRSRWLGGPRRGSLPGAK